MSDFYCEYLLFGGAGFEFWLIPIVGYTGWICCGLNVVCWGDFLPASISTFWVIGDLLLISCYFSVYFFFGDSTGYWLDFDEIGPLIVMRLFS